jgi:hypothetical protein
MAQMKINNVNVGFLFIGVSAVGTSGFDAQMSSIKLWKVDENLGPVY